MAKRLSKTVFVGMSGGVDSSVSAMLLKKQGFNVVGVFIRTWQPDFIECTWRNERKDAMRVCAHLRIPFLECDAEEVYKNDVANYMIEEYKNGRTPNPDVMCNREVKFGAFWDFAKEHGADYIATGHYARISNLNLMKGVDASKDQSYFLWTLTKQDLEHIIFPIGHLHKNDVRKLAEKYNIPTAMKKDSQGVCFLGPLDMKDFLKHFIEEKKGNVENLQGDIIGSHEGALFYTLGERHGFDINNDKNNSKPYYVVKKDIIRNVIIVSNNKDEIKNQNETTILKNVAIREELFIGMKYKAQIRYHGEYFDCNIAGISSDKINIKFTQNVSIDKGQSVVLYNDDICVAGGIVE